MSKRLAQSPLFHTHAYWEHRGRPQGAGRAVDVDVSQEGVEGTMEKGASGWRLSSGKGSSSWCPMKSASFHFAADFGCDMRPW